MDTEIPLKHLKYAARHLSINPFILLHGERETENKELLRVLPHYWPTG